MKTLILLFLGVLCAAGSVYAVTLEWDANTETNLAGYRVYVGRSSRAYSTNFVTTNTFFVFTNLAASVGGLPATGTAYFFAVTAFDTQGLESDYSDEVSLTLTNRPLKVQNVRFSARLTVQSAPAVNGPWSREPELGEVDFTPPSRFFRLALLPIAPASLLRPMRLEPSAGSKAGKLPLIIPPRPRQLPPFPPG